MTKRSEIDAVFMMECLTLAEKGRGNVSPNPLVGAILTQRKKIIGRGYHNRFGGPHAEVSALRSSTVSTRGATLYVNLEPCNIYGKTPPCTDLIISSGISRVVVGMKDPNPLVAGKGIRQLRRSGISVDVGVLSKECEKLNEAFTKYIVTGSPFVTLKVAQTLDGKIANVRGNSHWITNPASRTLVHRLRATSDAVLVGAGTVAQDNPLLTVRDVRGRNPVRVILDGQLSIDPHAKVAAPSHVRTIVITSTHGAKKHQKKMKTLKKNGAEIVVLPGQVNGSLPLKKVLKLLGSRGIASLLVEGGARTFSAFLDARLVDKVIVFIAPKILGEGLSPFPHFEGSLSSHQLYFSQNPVMRLGDDLLIEAYLHK
ncbi:MAG: bifunctional diaminohydroxyphosphoribosylaminopyrimidine deaminase/5-amino-6-(5-phosphoribosylamino)uracil reductase RibD [Ignavibacteria bacterium]|nr:bifunctional diaminohydroxyphosphoribosylaminopyrimidine deaminase/5-amino-6-(5-phosphoribosylamino)uracil reductase RibD [Ignavibacteria bacterium]